MNFIKSNRLERPIQLLGLLLCLATPALGATYYIDFDGGNDDNSGESQDSAWRTIPGTRTLDGSAFLRVDYAGGKVGKNSKLPIGTVIKFKRGTTYNASIGGFIWIDKTYYTDGATSMNAFSFEPADGWGTGPVTFDAMDIPIAVTLFQIQLDGTTLDGKTPEGFVVKNCGLGGLTIKEKQGTGAPVNQCALLNMKFVNNGWSYLTDKAGSGSGQLSVRKGAGLRIENVVMDGNHNFINGIILGDNHKTVIGATVENCEAYNHKGDLANNDSGIGFKAFNSQVLFKNDRSHDNLKGFDLGEQSSDNANMSYMILNCSTYNNCWGANMNCAGNSGYTGLAYYYVINTLIYNNSVQGMNVYSGPFNLRIVHNIFANNGGTVVSGKASGHLRITPDTALDDGVIRVRFYNNIFYKAYHSVLNTAWFDRQNNMFTMDSDYNSYIQGGTEFFCRWAYYHTGQSADFQFGENGPGHASGKWAKQFGNDNVRPEVAMTGHYGCDVHSKGTGADDPSLPQFVDLANNDFRLRASYSGLNLETKPWYVPEMSFDREGKKRVGWDMGPYDSGKKAKTLLKKLK